MVASPSAAAARHWLERIGQLKIERPLRVMNVCGGHERTLTTAGIRSLLPPTIELIPGPGCPVCVCPEEAIALAIHLALDERVILLAFGDMLRVPITAPKGAIRSLDQARAAGGDIRPIASPYEAARIARDHPGHEVVFFAAGFETTTAPVAALVAEGIPDNLRLLLAARRTWPAVAMLLESGTPGFDALIAPGHVSAVMGADEWRFVAEQHRIPTAVAGFTPEGLLAALYNLLSQLLDGRAELHNGYPEVVTDRGNPRAQALLDQVLAVVDAEWRGIGTIPRSGYALRGAYAAHDARLHYPVSIDISRYRADGMPPGCDCAEVVLGRRSPDQCRLYGRACTPRSPVGPCMVSDEGACRIWWAGGVRQPRATADKRTHY